MPAAIHAGHVPGCQAYLYLVSDSVRPVKMSVLSDECPTSITPERGLTFTCLLSARAENYASARAALLTLTLSAYGEER